MSASPQLAAGTILYAEKSQATRAESAKTIPWTHSRAHRPRLRPGLTQKLTRPNPESSCAAGVFGHNAEKNLTEKLTKPAEKDERREK